MHSLISFSVSLRLKVTFWRRSIFRLPHSAVTTFDVRVSAADRSFPCSSDPPQTQIVMYYIFIDRIISPLLRYSQNEVHPIGG